MENVRIAVEKYMGCGADCGNAVMCRGGKKNRRTIEGRGNNRIVRTLER